MSQQKRKRRKDPEPAFADATALVSATQFGSRRLPEMRTFYDWIMMFSPTKHHKANAVLSSEAVLVDGAKALASYGRKTSSRHLRRRVATYKPGKQKFTPRSRSRRSSVLQKQHEPSAATKPVATPLLQKSNMINNNNPNDPEEQHTTPNTKRPFWMATHIWHAKRFRMETLWEWKVPMIHSNRGCSAALRLVREGKTLIQDATWCSQYLGMQIIIPCLEEEKKNWDDAFQNAIRLCIPDFHVVMEDSNTSGEGMMHLPGSFPKDAVGPITWLQLSQPLLGHDNVAQTSGGIFFYFFVHPSIEATSTQCLLKAAQNYDAGESCRFFKGRVACLRLRGLNTRDCLQNAFRSEAEHDMNACEEIIKMGKGDNIVNHGEISTESNGMINGVGHEICLRTIYHRSPAVLANAGVVGVDIFCQLSHAKDLFISLIIKGGACPIGAAEETYLSIECDPPLPVFPRDFPDTEQGKIYWENSSEFWNNLRRYWEGGTGRVRAQSTTLQSISWCELAGKKELGGQPLVVRGCFGEPFSHALSASANYSINRSTNTRRNRRPTHGKRFYKFASKLSEIILASHQEFCKSLAGKLSLPTILLCQIQMAGPGMVKPGTLVHAIEDVERVLAIVTLGTFSVSRGHCHGIGLVSGLLFLEAVALPNASVVVTGLDGSERLHLKVIVRNGNQFFQGTLLPIV